MSTYESYLHTGLRGIFYFLKKACSTLFLLCLGFLWCLLFQLEIKADGLTKEDIKSFISVFTLLLFGSALLWFLFRALHSSWVRRHLKQSKIDFLEQLNREGIISTEALQQAKMRLI